MKSQTYWPQILLAIVLGAGCFLGLGSAGIFDRDEGLYTTASRQMIESGDWIVPRIGAEVRFAKPPLIYWLQAPVMLLLGPTPLAARLPSALATALTSLLLLWWAKRHGQERVGYLAAIIYALCPLAMIQSRLAITDSVLTLCFTLTIIGWIEGYQGDRNGYLLMAVGAGLTTLTKGVIGFLLPGAVLILWPLLRREPSRLRSVPWLLMLPIFLVIVLPWHWAMWQATGPAFIQEYLIANHFARFAGQKYGHHQPFWFYLPILLVGTFPWSIFLPLAWWQNWQANRKTAETTAETESANTNCFETMLGQWGLWAVLVILFFSASKSKLPEYVLPAFPALSLLIAARLNALWSVPDGLSKGEKGFFGFMGLLLGTAFTTIGIIGWRLGAHPVATLWGKKVTARFVEIVGTLAPLGLALGAIYLLGTLLILFRWRDTSKVAGTAIGMNLLFIVCAVYLGVIPWSRYAIDPLHDLGRQAIPALERGEPLVIYKLKPTRTSLRFVVGHTPLVTETDSTIELQKVITRHRHGLILTTSDTVLSSLPNTSLLSKVHEVSRARQWVLWQWDGDGG